MRTRVAVYLEFLSKPGEEGVIQEPRQRAKKAFLDLSKFLREKCKAVDCNGRGVVGCTTDDGNDFKNPAVIKVVLEILSPEEIPIYVETLAKAHKPCIITRDFQQLYPPLAASAAV